MDMCTRASEGREKSLAEANSLTGGSDLLPPISGKQYRFEEGLGAIHKGNIYENSAVRLLDGRNIG
jgi:hypothetical protein